MNQTEQWKDVKHYEGLYQISDLGNVKALTRFSENIRQIIKEKILHPDKIKSGYLRVVLTKETIRTRFLVHRLVAFHFIDNAENKNEVNHINHNKEDNRAVNLEWSTKSENIKHSVKAGFISKPVAKIVSVQKISLGGCLLEEYSSIIDAANKNNCASANIIKCCKGERKSTGGFMWQYKQ